MSQQINVEKTLEFVGAANKGDNVYGHFSTEKVVYYNDFVGLAVDTTNDFTLTTTNSGTATVTVPHMLTITTNAKDNDNTELAMGVEWYGQYDATMEARFRCDIPTNSAFFIGLNDAVTEGSADLPLEFVDGGITTQGADTAGLVYDLDCTTANMYFGSVKGDADGAIINSNTAITAAKLYTTRIELRDNGTTTDAFFYLNSSGLEIDPINNLVGVEVDAVARLNALCPYIGLMNRVDAVACTFDVDYLKVWQDRR